MKSSEIEELIKMAGDAGLGGDMVRFNGQVSQKTRFRDLGIKYLKALAAKLGLAKGDFEVSFNPAGPAVAGEATLRSTRFFVQIGVSTCGILYRRCERVASKPARSKAGLRYESAHFGNCWLAVRDLADMDGFTTRLCALECGAVKVTE